ncbi:MAG: DUF3365 domain-containing protein [Saprospirales bacterium]|nr:DUF3365 domain-containing protein [Saprospirales bacterium]
MKLLSRLYLPGLLFALFWLAGCTGRPAGGQADAAPKLDSLRAEGRRIAKASFEELSQQLARALETGGIPYALQFCHANAGPLTDSLSAKHGARIRRTAGQYRNPANAPDAQELALFETFAAQKTRGRDLKTADTALVLAPGKVLFAKPILLLPQCAVCHGKVGDTVTEELYREIKKRYPEDRAVGFSAGDLRGMWAIYFE